MRRAASAAALLTLASASCRGEDRKPAETHELLKLGLEDLMKVRVTTVSRDESTVGRSPAAVFVIDQEQIRRSGATAFPELFRIVPGMSVASVDGMASEKESRICHRRQEPARRPPPGIRNKPVRPQPARGNQTLRVCDDDGQMVKPAAVAVAIANLCFQSRPASQMRGSLIG
ncbi:MAG: hypothetical protein NTV08_15550 [Verrucomicrobia bacterium]|nr:hypothetical protein [Verrucomicrobiota bacterium]